MGKKRTITIGSEEEQIQKEEAAKRREVKKAAKMSKAEAEAHSETAEVVEGSSVDQTIGEEQEIAASSSTPRDDKSEAKEEKKETKKQVKQTNSDKYQPSPRHNANKEKVTKQLYTLPQALETLLEFKKAGFDETVELHINTLDKLNGNVVLPHGTGKEIRVAILAPTQDAQAAQKLLERIDAGQIDFDLLIATPDAMPRLAKAAKVLGPRGLMPNPKNGTVSANPEEAAKKFAGGQMNYKTESKTNIVHVSIGKLSFGKEKLSDNAKALLGALEKGKAKSVYLKSTMSPSLRIG